MIGAVEPPKGLPAALRLFAAECFRVIDLLLEGFYDGDPTAAGMLLVEGLDRDLVAHANKLADSPGVLLSHDGALVTGVLLSRANLRTLLAEMFEGSEAFDLDERRDAVPCVCMSKNLGGWVCWARSVPISKGGAS